MKKTIGQIVVEVEREVSRAQELHRPYASTHEAFAVLWEEIDEFWEEVRKKREFRSKDAMRSELLQIAAVACRAIHDLDL